MSDGRETEYLTQAETKRFDAMAKFDTVKAAAVSLGLSPNTLYNWRRRIKKRYKLHRGKANAYQAQIKRGGSLTTLLHERRKMQPLEDPPEEWDDEN